MALRTLGDPRPKREGGLAATCTRLRRPGALPGWRAQALSALSLGLLAVLLAATYPLGLAVADEAAQAGLVVQFDDGRMESRCIAIAEDGTTGADLLAMSGLEVIMDTSSGMGVTVCQINNLGCPYPAKPCFCQCMSGSECGYWNYYYREPGRLEWVYSPLGARLRKLEAGVVEAWVWGDGSTPPSDALTFEAICGTVDPSPPSKPEAGEERGSDSPIPSRTTPLKAPQLPGSAAVATEEPAATAVTPGPTAGVAALPAATSSASSSVGSSVSSYWLFGLMVLALGAMALLLRRRSSGGT